MTHPRGRTEFREKPGQNLENSQATMRSFQISVVALSTRLKRLVRIPTEVGHPFRGK